MSFLTSFQNSVIAKEPADLIVAKGEERRRRSQCMGKRFGGKIAGGLRLSGSLPSHTLHTVVEHHQTCLTSKFKTNISWIFCISVNLRQRFQSETYE